MDFDKKWLETCNSLGVDETVFSVHGKLQGLSRMLFFPGMICLDVNRTPIGGVGGAGGRYALWTFQNTWVCGGLGQILNHKSGT